MSGSSVSLSANTSLNQSVLLTWVNNGYPVTTIGDVAGYVTVIDTTYDASVPVVVYLTYDDIVSGQFAVENLINGRLYAFTLSIYTTDFETIVKSNIVLDTPADVPQALVITAPEDADEIPNVRGGGIIDVSLNVKVTIGSNGGLPIEKIYLYLVDTSNYVSTTYLYLSSNYDFTEGNLCLLPVSGSLNKKYYIYGEAINDSGSSKPSNRVILDTTNKPPDVKVSSIVSGLNSSMQVSLELINGPSFYRLVKASVLVWDISANGDTTNTTNWSSITAVDFTATDSNGSLILNNLTINGLQNGRAYRVAAYVTNVFQNGNKTNFNVLQQTKTGVPVRFPVFNDFNNNFTLSKTLNTSLGVPNGILTVTSSSNLSGVTSRGYFTFDPIYDVSLTDLFDYSAVVSSGTPFSCVANGVDVKPETNYFAYITVKTNITGNLLNYWSNSQTHYVMSTPVQVSTTGKPSDMIVNNVVSGLDSKLRLSLTRADGSTSALTSVTILLWNITSRGYTSSTPSNWSLHDISFNLTPVGGVINLDNIEINGLQNGHAYQVAAYATNSLGDSYYNTFAPSQLSTGVPAILPVLSDFSNNFSLAKILNSSSGSPNGILTVNSANVSNVTTSGRFTIDPVYDISFSDLSAYSNLVTSATQFPYNVNSVNVPAGVNYYASITVKTNITGNLLTYWSNPESQYVLTPINVDTTSKPSDMIVNNVVSGLDSKLSVSLTRADGSTSALTSVTILLWDITVRGNNYTNSVPSNWSSHDVSLNVYPSNNTINLSNIDINGLQNGHAYQVAAYATNSSGNSYYSSFAPSQMKTGVPARLPVLSDFSNNFNITGTMSTDSNTTNGQLNITSVNNASQFNSIFTIAPTYQLRLYSSASIETTIENIAQGSPSLNKSNIVVVSGLNYYGSIIVNTTIASPLAQYWLNGTLQYQLPTITIGPLYLSTAPLDAPAITQSSVYISPDFATSATFGISLQWNAPVRDGFSSILGYIVKYYNSANNIIYKGYTSQLSASLVTSKNGSNQPILISPPLSGDAFSVLGVSGISGVDYTVFNSNVISSRLERDEWYKVSVIAINANGISPERMTNQIYITLPPDPVSNIDSYQLLDKNYNDSAMPTTGKVTISWTSPSIAAGLTFIRYDIFKYTSNVFDNTTATLYSSPTTTTFTTDTLPVSSPFYFGIKVVTKDIYDTVYTSAVNNSSYTFTAVPTISLPVSGGFTRAGNGNGIVTFYVNNGGSSLIGLTIMVLPDASIATNVDPVTIASINSGVFSVGIGKTISVTANSGGVNNDQYVLSLNYKIPDTPSYLIVATNRVGSDVYYANFSV
jgi:hypothetical protein